MTFTRPLVITLAIFVSASLSSFASPVLASWTDPVVVDTSPPIDDGYTYFRGDADSLGLGMTPAGVLRVIRASGRGTWARSADQDGPVTPQQSLNYGDFPLGAFGDSLETEWLSSAAATDGTMAAGLPYGQWSGNPHPGGFEGWRIAPQGSPGRLMSGNRTWRSSPTIRASVALSPQNAMASAWSESISLSSVEPDQCRVLFSLSSPVIDRSVFATYDHPSCGAVSVTSLAGGAWLVAWVDGRWGPDEVSKINLVRVAANGTWRELLFQPLLVAGRVRGGERTGLPLASTTDGDALLAWRDDRGVVVLPVSAAGTVSSVEVVAQDAAVANLSLRSGAGAEADPILAWSTGDGTTSRLHAARLSSSGSARWMVSTPEVRGIVSMDATGTPAGRTVLTWRSRNLRDRNLDTIRVAEISSLEYLNPTQIVGSGRGGGSFQGRIVRVTSSTTNHVAIAWSDWEATNASWDGYVFPPPDPLPAGCPDVYAVGVRGSRGDRETNPMDEPYVGERAHDRAIKLFMDRLEQRTGLDIQRRWIRYPAAPASNALHSWRDPFRTEEYNSSVDDGISALQAELTNLQRPGGCVSHGTQVVLAGYSQGAQVIGRAVDDDMSMTGVTAVSLFGDPTFSADHSGDATYTSTLGIAPNGVLGARSKDFPQDVFVTSFCRPHDFVCDVLNGTFNVCTPLYSACVLFPEHGRYEDSVVVGSGPFWDYEEKTLPPPPVQSADKVATQVLRVQSSATTRIDSTGRTPGRQPMSAPPEPDSTDEPPVVVLPSRLNVRPSQPLVLSAGLSYDPGGALLLYEWDLNGDGRYDAPASLAPSAPTSFATTPTGPVRLRVTNEFGLQSTAQLAINISSTGPSRPGAPTSLRGTAGPRSVSLAWDPPTDTGGLPTTGYLVRDATTGDLAGFGESSPNVTLTDQTPGVARRFTVAARNEAGVGSASAPSASVTPTAETSPSGTPPPPRPSSPFGIIPPDSAQTAPPVGAGTSTPSDRSSRTPSSAPFFVSIKTVRLSRRQLARRPAFGISCHVSTGAACSVKATLTRSTAQRLRLKIKRAATPLTVARGRANLRNGGSAIVMLRTTSRFRSAVRQYRRKWSLTVTATAVNLSGERRTVSRRMRITR